MMASGGEAGAAPRAIKVKKETDWRAELKSLALLLLAVFGFHSLVAKPFYIPSESMLPGLRVGDQLVVSKYPYGWSYVSPSFHLLPAFHGRLFGHMPERGDVVIVTPPGTRDDWIKRVIGVPGDRVEVRAGALILNGVPVKRSAPVLTAIPVDEADPCTDYRYQKYRSVDANGHVACRLPMIRETLPGGRTYETLDLGQSAPDDYPEITVPAGHVFLMGDNRDNSADSRVATEEGGLGGPVPWEQLGGRAEFITFSLDGSQHWWNPLSWPGAFRSGRAGLSLHPKREG